MYIMCKIDPAMFFLHKKGNLNGIACKTIMVNADNVAEKFTERNFN